MGIRITWEEAEVAALYRSEWGRSDEKRGPMHPLGFGLTQDQGQGYYRKEWFFITFTPIYFNIYYCENVLRLCGKRFPCAESVSKVVGHLHILPTPCWTWVQDISPPNIFPRTMTRTDVSPAYFCQRRTFPRSHFVSANCRQRETKERNSRHSVAAYLIVTVTIRNSVRTVVY